MTPPSLFDHLGQPVRIGQRLGTGGEGVVFEVATAPDMVAKVYHEPPGAQKEAKLRAMVSLGRAELIKVAAWPTATLHERPGGPTVGLTMRRIRDYQEVHTLYSPAHRKTAFPQADWRFLVTVAMNCAAALLNLHECGVVVGDVNQSNVLVSAAGVVALIDCDSFQIQANGRPFPCEVGVPLFTPPELQNQSFRGLVRTPNHDRFGLAVLIFHLLFMGRHPFSGRFLGRGEMPLERAIAEYRFAYGASARAHQMQPPLYAPAPSAASPLLAGLFDRAFTRGSERPNSRPSGAEWFNSLKAFGGSLRSCAADPGHFYPPHLGACCWCELMRQGAPNFFVSVAFYRPAASAGPPFVLAAVWGRIEQVPPPDVRYRRPASPPAARPAPLPPGVPAAIPAKPAPPKILTAPPAPPCFHVAAPSRARVIIPRGTPQRVVTVVLVVAFATMVPCAIYLKPLAVMALLSFLVFGVWWGVLEGLRRGQVRQANQEYDAELAELRAEARQRRHVWESRLAAQQAGARRQYEQELEPWRLMVAAFHGELAKRTRAKEDAEQRVRAAEASWAAAASRHAAAFQVKKDDLSNLRRRHEELTRAYALARQGLQSRVRETQLAIFLQRHFISDASIPDIGPSRTATLASFGIETAFDIEVKAVRQIPGFGPKYTHRLVDWRRQVEARFVFNAAVGVPHQEQQSLNIKYATGQQPVEAQLLAGERELRAVLSQADFELRRLYEQIRCGLQVLGQAECDLRVFVAKG
jgi:DNA-binding helix-hairpin-helix protein with protein kinase domain